MFPYSEVFALQYIQGANDGLQTRRRLHVYVFIVSVELKFLALLIEYSRTIHTVVLLRGKWCWGIAYCETTDKISFHECNTQHSYRI